MCGRGTGRGKACDGGEADRHASLHAGWRVRGSGGAGLFTTLNGSTRRGLDRGGGFFSGRGREPGYFARAAVGRKKQSGKGFTPRLNWTWSHIHSNHFYYRYNNHRVFLDIFKQF